MSYANFKPTIWSQFIQRELEKKCKLVADCWSQFEGEAKHGNKVKILGVAPITIGDYKGTSIGAPQTQEGNLVELDIDQAKFFNFGVDDVDRAQSIEGLMPTLMAEATHRMAVARDSFVASLAKDAEQMSATLAIQDPEDAKAAIDAGLLALRENDVDLEDNVVIEIAPFVYQLLRDNLAALKTNNDELIRKGAVGMYDNCVVKMTNNLYNDGTDDYCMIRTKKAIAFAGQIDSVEAYRPDDLFCDAVKGLNVFGAKIVRPKELYVIKAHK
jgi:hypothetical protein